MNELNVRRHAYPVYPICAPSSSKRLSDTLNPTWMTTRQKEETARAEWGSMKAQTGQEGSFDKPAGGIEQHEGADQANADNLPDAKPEGNGLRAYGYVFQNGVQHLTVKKPGESAPVHFRNHNCLKHIDHAENDAEVIVREAGDYEITFELCLSAKAAAPVLFELRREDGVLPGGAFQYILSNDFRECRGTVMARLRENDHISVVMTSASTCETTLAAGGVSAGLWLKKLD